MADFKYPSASSKNNGAGVSVPGYRHDVLESEEGYSPVLRTLGFAAVGAAAYQLHSSQLKNSPTYASNLYRWAEKFEDLTPSRLGTTFGLSERASSYTINELHFSQEQLMSNGRLTETGQHFQRMFGDKVDVTQAAKGGLHFRRTERGSPFLDLDGVAGVRVRFAKTGRMSGSSFRYNRPLEDRPFHWSQDPRPHQKAWSNFTAARRDQDPLLFNLNHGARASRQGKFAPWYASYESDTVGNFKRAVGPQAFELFERPQRLFSEFGLGLRQGSYNKIFHIPFIGEGGLLNNLLLKRVLPIAVGLTAARWLDYKTNHVASDAVINTGLKASLFRADLTDHIPGLRSITDWYAQEEGGLPQYAPLALPLGGMFVGGAIHMGQVATGRFQGSARPARLVRAAAGRTFPKVSVLKKALREGFSAKAAATIWKGLGTPGKGALVGLAFMLPFVPGMIGSRKTGSELRRIYSGEEEVPVRQGRWWEVGSTPFSGTRITAWRPHESIILKSHAREKSLYGSEENYWSHNPFLHPLRWLKDPYYLERLHEKDRPYPITSPAFSNVPVIGSFLAATAGKLIKPVQRMHVADWDEKNYTLYSNRLEPRGPDGLPPAAPKEEFSPWNTFKREVVSMAEFIGLPGFIMRSAYNAAYPQHGQQDVFLQGSRQMTSASRAYYEKNMGAGMFISPDIDHGFTGYTEPLRRFIQPEGYTLQVNEIPNTMPSWMPGEDYLINFQKGDPYIKVDEGYARLPGTGYEAVHPEIAGLKPEDYPDIARMRILGDVAPYSREYQKYSSRVLAQSRDNPALEAEYDRIAEQVRQTKESTLQVAKRHFNSPVDTIEGTVKSASDKGVELKEYPGRTFHFSSVGTSVADLTAEILGSSNKITRSQAVQEADIKTDMRAKYLADVLAEGTHVKAVVPRGAADSSADISAVISADDRNVNRELINQGYGAFRTDLGGAEQQAMHGRLGQLFGKYTEELFFDGDQGRLNPMRYVANPFATKYAQERTALSQYTQQQAVGTRMRRWERPIHDFLAPYLRGAIARVTGEDVIPKEVQHRRDLDTLADMLQYLRAETQAAADPKHSGGYTSQSKRTNIGANLYSSSGFVASTLSSREARYFRKFVQETDPEVREKILNIVPDETRQALTAQWQKQKERISEAEGNQREDVGAQGRPYTDEDLDEYKHADTGLQLGDYLRSRQIARFFFTRKFNLPTAQDSEALDPNLDYQDVKLKIVQQEGYDAHDFNLFDDRSNTLWRKPYVDGAVRELTAGDSRSEDQLRQAVEQIMVAAGNQNPDVRYTTRKSHRSRANITVDAQEDDTQDVLTDMRRNPDEYKE